MKERTKNADHALFELRFQCFLSNGALVMLFIINNLVDGDDRLLKFVHQESYHKGQNGKGMKDH